MRSLQGAIQRPNCSREGRKEENESQGHLQADILVLLPDVCHRHAVDDLSECGGLLLPPFVLPTFPHHIQLREFRGVFVFLHLRRPRLDSAGVEEVESFQSTPRCASLRRRGTRDPHGGNNFLTPEGDE